MRKSKGLERGERTAESRKQGEEECRNGWNKGEKKMEDGRRRRAEAAEHRWRSEEGTSQMG